MKKLQFGSYKIVICTSLLTLHLTADLRCPDLMSFAVEPALSSQKFPSFYSLDPIPWKVTWFLYYHKTDNRRKKTKMAAHPYIPINLELPGFLPIALTQTEILLPYLASSLAVVIVTWLISGWFPKISKIERWLMCWWAFTGLTRIILEGYFAFTPDFYKKMPYLAELWKEYSKGDSRHAGRDAAIVTVEGITVAIEGPACLLAVYAIATKKAYNHTLQLAISLGQLYGCLVYFITAYLLPYWLYYIQANFWWILIPSLIVVRLSRSLVWDISLLYDLIVFDSKQH